MGGLLPRPALDRRLAEQRWPGPSTTTSGDAEEVEILVLGHEWVVVTIRPDEDRCEDVSWGVRPAPSC